MKWLPNLKSIFSASIILSQVHLETEKMISRINESSRLNVREGSNRSLQLKKNTFISFYSCFAYDALEHWSVWQYKAPLFHSWFLLFVFLIFCTASDVFFHQFLVVFIDNSEHSETKLKSKNQKTKKNILMLDKIKIIATSWNAFHHWALFVIKKMKIKYVWTLFSAEKWILLLFITFIVIVISFLSTHVWIGTPSVESRHELFFIAIWCCKHIFSDNDIWICLLMW